MREISEGMGGNAIIISGSKIAWMRYNLVLTTGTANIEITKILIISQKNDFFS